MFGLLYINITICPWKAGLCERRDMHRLLLGMLLIIDDVNIVSLHQAWESLLYYSEVKGQSSASDWQVDRFHQAPNSLWLSSSSLIIWSPSPSFSLTKDGTTG